MGFFQLGNSLGSGLSGSGKRGTVSGKSVRLGSDSSAARLMEQTEGWNGEGRSSSVAGVIPTGSRLLLLEVVSAGLPSITEMCNEDLLLGCICRPLVIAETTF